MNQQGHKRRLSLKSLFVLSLCSFLFLLSGLARAKAENSLFGFWQTAGGDGIVEIYPCDQGQACGRFAWLKEDSEAAPSLDNKNPDPALRRRRLMGLTFMGGFKPGAAPETYEDGWIYSPRHGSRFSANLKLAGPDALELHGYMFLPVLGESQIWKRVPKPGKE